MYAPASLISLLVNYSKSDSSGLVINQSRKMSSLNSNAYVALTENTPNKNIAGFTIIPDYCYLINLLARIYILLQTAQMFLQNYKIIVRSNSKIKHFHTGRIRHSLTDQLALQLVKFYKIFFFLKRDLFQEIRFLTFINYYRPY